MTVGNPSQKPQKPPHALPLGIAWRVRHFSAVSKAALAPSSRVSLSQSGSPEAAFPNFHPFQMGVTMAGMSVFFSTSASVAPDAAAVPNRAQAPDMSPTAFDMVATILNFLLYSATWLRHTASRCLEQALHASEFPQAKTAGSNLGIVIDISVSPGGVCRWPMSQQLPATSQHWQSRCIPSHRTAPDSRLRSACRTAVQTQSQRQYLL